MILYNSSGNPLLNPVHPMSTVMPESYTRYGPPIQPARPTMRASMVSDYLTPREIAFHQTWTMGQGPAMNRWANRYMTGAAFSGGLGQAGELIGRAVGQSVLNRAFSVAQGGGPLASYATALARRMALGPGEVAAGVLGNVGHLAGIRAAGIPGQGWTGGILGAVQQQGLWGAGLGQSQVQQWTQNVAVQNIVKKIAQATIDRHTTTPTMRAPTIVLPKPPSVRQTRTPTAGRSFSV